MTKSISITCISDLHGAYPDLESGDLLIIAGDLTTNDKTPEYIKFFDWLKKQKFRKKIFLGGNHDGFLEMCLSSSSSEKMGLREDFFYEYLLGTGCDFEGLKIWGSPWTLLFEGCNPLCTAFMLDSEEKLAEKWALIPDDTDILITHSPPQGILDKTSRKNRVGSKSLLKRVNEIKPLLHIFGHIHEGYGIEKIDKTLFVNAAHMNVNYKPKNKRICIELFIREGVTTLGIVNIGN